MTTQEALTIIKKYLLCDECADKAWVEVLELCKNALLEKLEKEKPRNPNARSMKDLIESMFGSVREEAIKAFQRTSKERLTELYEKYHAIANNPQKETDLFYQGRAEAIWECIKVQKMSEWEEYVRYLTSCLFSHTDYFTEEKILSFEEFKQKLLKSSENNKIESDNNWL